jgi:hypothetical protein
MRGLVGLVDQASLAGLVGTHPRLLGCVVTRWQDNRLNQDAVRSLDQLFLTPNHIPLFATRIKFDANVQRDEGGNFLQRSLGQKTAALQYTDLTEEVLQHVEQVEQVERVDTRARHDA